MHAKATPERWMTIRVYGNLVHTVGAWNLNGTANVEHPATGRPTHATTGEPSSRP